MTEQDIEQDIEQDVEEEVNPDKEIAVIRTQNGTKHPLKDDKARTEIQLLQDRIAALESKLDLLAKKSSPALTGYPTTTTPSNDADIKQIANVEYVRKKVTESGGATTNKFTVSENEDGDYEINASKSEVADCDLIFIEPEGEDDITLTGNDQLVTNDGVSVVICTTTAGGITNLVINSDNQFKIKANGYMAFGFISDSEDEIKINFLGSAAGDSSFDTLLQGLAGISNEDIDDIVKNNANKSGTNVLMTTGLSRLWSDIRGKMYDFAMPIAYPVFSTPYSDDDPMLWVGSRGSLVSFEYETDGVDATENLFKRGLVFTYAEDLTSLASFSSDAVNFYITQYGMSPTTVGSDIKYSMFYRTGQYRVNSEFSVVKNSWDNATSSPGLTGWLPMTPGAKSITKDMLSEGLKSKLFPTLLSFSPSFPAYVAGDGKKIFVRVSVNPKISSASLAATPSYSTPKVICNGETYTLSISSISAESLSGNTIEITIILSNAITPKSDVGVLTGIGNIAVNVVYQ